MKKADNYKRQYKEENPNQKQKKQKKQKKQIKVISRGDEPKGN